MTYDTRKYSRIDLKTFILINMLGKGSGIKIKARKTVILLFAALLSQTSIVYGEEVDTRNYSGQDIVRENDAHIAEPMAETLTLLPGPRESGNSAKVKVPPLNEFFGDVVIDNIEAAKSFSPEMRIINGEKADPKNYPFLVSLQLGAHYCAGSAIHPKVIVTAAHCVEPIRRPLSSDPKVVGAVDANDENAAGSKLKGTKASVVRGGYNAATHESDIAILLLEEPVEGVQTIEMAPPDVEVSSNAELKIAGWGLENEKSDALSPSLMEAAVFFVDNDECNKILGYGRVSDSMICAGDLINGRDACQGDSGGPLILTKEFSPTGEPMLLGVVSWGIGCGRIGLPGVYSSVPYFNSWIQSYVDQWESEGRL